MIREIVDSETLEVCAAASSKVLITGAYLIIDPKNEGIVLSTDAKFYTTVKQKKSKKNVSTIMVNSPQFKMSLEYKIVKDISGTVRVKLC